MRLPKQAFSRILRALGVEPPPPGGGRPHGPPADDTSDGPQEGAARREPRWRVSVDVPCARHGTVGGRLRTVSLRDVSAVGLCVVSNFQLGAGDRFVIYLPWGDGEHVPVVCTAKSVRIRAEGNWRIGAEFVEAGDDVLNQRSRVRAAGALMTEAAADVYFRVPLDPTQPMPELKPRRHERTAARGEAVIYTYDADRDGSNERRGPLEKVQARDVSDGGVSILRAEPMEIGQRFVVHLSAPGAESQTRLCRVVHVTLSDSRYRVGAQFVAFPNRQDPRKRPRKGLSRRLREWFAGDAKPALG